MPGKEKVDCLQNELCGDHELMEWGRHIRAFGVELTELSFLNE